MFPFRLICLLIGYAFGCIQTAYIIGKFGKNIDVREHGSGNAGTSNAIRVMGKRAGLAVFVCDVLKGVAAFTVCAFIFGGYGSFIPSTYAAGYEFLPEAVNQTLGYLPGIYGGLGAVLGHNFPFFLKFKGGKGIATMLGVMLALDWRAALPAYAAGVIVIIASKYFSLTSLTMVLLFPVILFLVGHQWEVIALMAAMTIMAFVLHRGNIARLLNGTERKLVLRKSKTTPSGL